MPEYLAPGVYVEETSFRSKPIEGVSTSTTGFVGPARKGPVNDTPELITSFGEFERVFGGFTPLGFAGAGERQNYLAHAVRGYFDNGGRRLYVVRTFTANGGNAGTSASEWVLNQAGAQARFVARFAGAAGNGRITVTEKAAGATWKTMGAAPEGSVALVGGGSAAEPANLDGGFAPFTVEHNAILRVDLGGGAQDLTFTGTRATRTGGAALALPNTTIDATNNTLEVAVNGLNQTLTLTNGPATPQEIVDEINLQIRGGSAALAGGGELIIRSEILGTDGTVGIRVANADLGFPAGPTLTDLETGTGVGDLGAVDVDDINVIIAASPIAGTLVASLNPGNGRLRLATAATGVAATLEVVNAGATTAHTALGLPAATDTGADGANLTVYVKSGSSWLDAGDVVLNQPVDEVEPTGGAQIVTLTVETRDADGRVAVYEGLGYGASHPLYIGSVLNANPLRRTEQLENLYAFSAVGNQITAFNLRTNLVGPSGKAIYELTGGNDGVEPTAAAYTAALAKLAEVDGISIVAAPGSAYLSNAGDAAIVTNARGIRAAIITHVEQYTRYRIAVLETPQQQAVSQALSYRSQVDTKYAALYYPWLMVANPLWRPGQSIIPAEVSIPSSGHVCGIYARNDTERGVHKAPANEVVRGIVRFESSINFAQQEVLNPQGVNAFRVFPGRGNRLWGARIATSDQEWKYVNIRRFFNYLEASIDRGTQWAVFEPNGEALWADIRQSVSDFLYNEWRNGALLGTSPKEAYFVRCDRSTMTQSDLDNGRLICEIGVAVVKPAEFVIFRIGQKTADAQA